MSNPFRNMQPMKIEEIVRVTEILRRRGTICEESHQTFQWTDYPRVRGKVQIMLEGGATGMAYASLNLFVADEDVGPPPDILPIPTVSYVLKDRVRGFSGSTQNVVRSTLAEFGCGSFNYGMDFECQLCPKDWFYSPIYNAGGSLELQVFVESPAAALAFHSYDGTLKWTIESWFRVRETLLKRFVNSHRSPYFYANGYRVQAWLSIVPVGGRVENVVVDIVFLSGLNDHRLSIRFPHSTTVTLKNPRYPVRGLVCESVEREQASRYQVVFPAGKINFGSLLVDDSFLLEVVIKAK